MESGLRRSVLEFLCRHTGFCFMKEFIHSRNDSLVEIYLPLMSERQRNVESPSLDPQFRVRFAKWAVPSNSPSRVSFPWYKMRESGLEDKISKIRFKTCFGQVLKWEQKERVLLIKAERNLLEGYLVVYRNYRTFGEWTWGKDEDPEETRCGGT